MRTRLYQDSNLCYFELKLKDKTNTTKKRKEIPLTEHGCLDQTMFDFANRHSSDIYDRKIESNNIPVLKTCYKRITLVGKNHEERVTFDFDFEFCGLTDQNKEIYKQKNMMIIEIKSNKEKSIGREIFRKNGLLPIEYGCSKYCIGLNLLKMVNKKNKFKQVLKAIAKI